MTNSIQNPVLGKVLRLTLCAALAFAVTSITTQLIVRSAGQHEYGIETTPLTAAYTSTDSARRLIVAQAR